MSYYSFSMTATCMPNSLAQVRGNGPRDRRGCTMNLYDCELGLSGYAKYAKSGIKKAGAHAPFLR
eukprot:1803572-Prymnesium_polylepis.1